MTGTLMMNAKERKTLSILQQHLGKLLTAQEGAEELGITERHFYRLKVRYAIEGDAGLVHRARGSGSNRGYRLSIREEVLALHRRKYGDYGPTLFAERLEINDGYLIDHETLRRWLQAANQMPVTRRGAKHRKKRPRKPHIGSMVQLDGSDHDWFEGRGPRCTLLVFIDDASSTVFMRFVTSENIKEVLAAVREYIERYGIPALFYTDKATVFHHATKTVDFVRALTVLGSKVIYAGSPQAKGRVERSNRTHQDRLVKIMREHGISSIEEANDFLDREYLADHNARFATPDGLEDVHRPATHFDLTNIFCFEVQRVVRRDMTVQYKEQILQILPPHELCPLPKQYLTLRVWLDGSIHLFWREHELHWKPVTTREPKRRQLPFGIAQIHDHPWQHKPVGTSTGTSHHWRK